MFLFAIDWTGRIVISVPAYLYVGFWHKSLRLGDAFGMFHQVMCVSFDVRCWQTTIHRVRDEGLLSNK